MELDYIKALAALMNEHDLSGLEVHKGEDAIVLSRQSVQSAAAIPVAVETVNASAPAPKAAAPADDANVIKAPLVGCVYLSASPDLPVFVQPGDAVKKGDTLCIVEAMKVMNEIYAPRDGVIAEVCVQNEQLVEYGQPLFRFK